MRCQLCVCFQGISNAYFLLTACAFIVSRAKFFDRKGETELGALFKFWVDVHHALKLLHDRVACLNVHFDRALLHLIYILVLISKDTHQSLLFRLFDSFASVWHAELQLLEALVEATHDMDGAFLGVLKSIFDQVDDNLPQAQLVGDNSVRQRLAYNNLQLEVSHWELLLKELCCLSHKLFENDLLIVLEKLLVLQVENVQHLIDQKAEKNGFILDTPCLSKSLFVVFDGALKL